MKRLFGLVLALAVVSFAIVSCKDDFNEEDFLKLQSDLRLKQDSINRARNQAGAEAENAEQAASLAAALNEAGELLGYTVSVRENNTPLAGVVVTVSTGSEQALSAGKTAAVFTATTGNDGNAVFDKVSYGRGQITFSKTGYASATATIDLGTVPTPQPVTTNVNGQTITRYLPPVKVFKSDVVQLFAKTGGTSATVKGKIRIQTDLTNATPEAPPAGTLIAADFSQLTLSPAGNLTNYVFDTGTFGTATTDASGNYSMTVPATLAGYTLTLIMPTLSLNQTIAVQKVDGVAIAPEYRSTPAVFGPGAVGDNVVPSVPGAVATFNAPPAAGSGLSFTLTARPRGLSVSTWSTASGADDFNPNTGGIQNANFGNPAVFDIGETVFQITNRGAGYTKSPVFTITGGGGTGAILKASLRGRFTGSTVSGGTGYVQGDVITINFNLKNTATPVVTQNVVSFNATVATVTSGAITSLTLPTSGTGFSSDWTTSGNTEGFDILNFETTVAGGSGTGATGNMSFTSEIEHVKLSNTGSGYTSAPSIAVDGGAVMLVREFRTQWNMTSPTRTTAYPVLPKSLKFEYTGMNFGTTQSAAIVSNAGSITDMLDALDLTSSGDPVFVNSGETYRTSNYSVVAPKLIEEVNAAVKAAAGLTIAADGTITGLVTTGAPYNAGNGYNAVPVITIAPSIATAPGSGAMATVQPGTSFIAQTGEYQWATANAILNAGSGYLQNLNQSNTNGAATANPQVTVKAGQVYVIDYDYNTGFRVLKFN